MSEAAPPADISADAAARRRARARFAGLMGKRQRSLVTPEGAELKLRIGTFGERAGAFIIDFIIQWTIVVVIVLSVGFVLNQLDWEAQGFGQAVLIILVFVFRNFYFIVFEIGRKAATPGKRLLGLRVAARNGGQLTADAVFARNFMREIEVGLPLSFLFMGGDPLNALIGLFGFLWAAVFLFFPLFNRDKLRVGDIVAGTWVIHAPKTSLMADIAASAPAPGAQAGFAFTEAQADAYGIHELHVLEDVLRESTDEIKAKVAARIRTKIGWARQQGESDRAFLEAYYATLRRRLEQRMLFGQRKTDKYDTR